MLGLCFLEEGVWAVSSIGAIEGFLVCSPTAIADIVVALHRKWSPCIHRSILILN